MTKKTVGYVELEWKCPNCGARNPGTQTKCAGCGAAQPQDVAFEQGVQEELLTDEAKIAQAQAGPDIHCGFCGTRNVATATKCRQCGAELKAGTKRQVGKVVGALQSEQAPPIACAVCGAENPAAALRCAKCGSPLTKPEPKPAVVAQRPTARPLPMGLIIAVAAIAILACVIFFVMTGSRRSEMVGRVDGVQWQRVILVQALVPVTRQDWREDIPAGVAVGNCVERVRSVQPEPAPGAVEVCGTPYVVDTGTGVGEVVQDCEYQVYGEWCDYQTTAWQAIAPIVLSGVDLNPRWPNPLFGQDQRESGRQQEYVVTFETEEGELRYTITDPERFAQFTPGSQWQIEQDGFGNIVSVQPAE